MTFALLAAACNVDLTGVCLVQGNGLRAYYLESLSDAGDADRSSLGADGGAFLSAATDAGRLLIVYDGPLVSERLPANHSDGGSCGRPGDYAYLLSVTDAGVSELLDVQATVKVTSSDGGTVVRCTQMTVGDGGTSLPDRDFSL